MIKQTYETPFKSVDNKPHLDDADFLSVVEGLTELEERSASVEREVLAAKMAENPELYMPTQFEQLAELYRYRSDRQTFHWNKHIEEATIFASRTLDHSRLEEVYLIFDEFGPHNRNWQTRKYIARIILDENGAERCLELDSSGEFSVRERTAEDQEWQRMYGEAADRATFDFFRESLRAVSDQMKRSEVERQDADDDALAKLISMYHSPRN